MIFPHTTLHSRRNVEIILKFKKKKGTQSVSFILENAPSKLVLWGAGCIVKILQQLTFCC